MKITLAERYQSFRRQHEADYPTGEDLDKAFLVEVLTKGYGNPDKAARVLQKYRARTAPSPITGKSS